MRDELARVMNWLRDSGAIYRQSFATIRAEADLDAVPAALQAVAIRLIHASGMVDIVGDLAFSGDVAAGAGAALAAGAPVMCDTGMVAAGVAAARLPAGNAVLCRLDEVGAVAGTTRSAAAVDLWLPDLAGAVVAIGNAPTALFRLLELIDQGAPRPAAVLAFPVGFVGAAESKAALVGDPRGLPFLTLLGRRGGSAMAVAAVNALARGLSP